MAEDSDGEREVTQTGADTTLSVVQPITVDSSSVCKVWNLAGVSQITYLHSICFRLQVHRCAKCIHTNK